MQRGLVILSLCCLSLSAQDQPEDVTPNPGAPPAVRVPGGAAFRTVPAARGSRGLPVVAQQMIAQGDKDGDKAVSKEEMTTVINAWFDKLDPQKTDKLTQEQLITGLGILFPPGANAGATEPAEDGAGAGRPTPPLSPGVLGPVLFAATDTDKDGFLTRAEFAEAFAKWFDTWDSAKSGKLDQEQLRKGLETALPRTAIARASSVARVRTRPAAEEEKAASNRSEPAPQPKIVESASPATISTNTPEALASGHDYAAFRIINERNIFNASRRARSRGGSSDEPKAKRAETITLVGTLSSEKGTFAFFDSSSSEFRKVLDAGKKIATYQVAAVAPNVVTLETGTNKVQLRVGGQLRKEEDGDWTVASTGQQPASEVSSPSSSSTSSDASSPDDDNDIVKRLMKQREQEIK